MSRRNRRPAALLLGGLLATSLAAPALADGSVRALYDVTFAGFRIARGSLAVNVEGRNYAARIQISTSGVARIVSGEESSASSSGRFSGTAVTPSSYNLFSQGDRTTQVAMQLASGSVSSLDASPPLAEHDDRVPVTDADRRHITDPLSAAILPFPASGDLEDACDRTLPIFDGWTRYDVRLSYKETQTVDLPGYSGPAVVCAARWVPIAGHREGRESTTFMAENRNIEGWFVPVPGADALIPYRVSLATLRGTLTVTANLFEVAPASN